MYETLQIIKYPDPRLKKISEPVTQFDASLRELTDRMFQLMREARGVGLAAPQVGINQRLFVMNPTGEPADDLVVVNPVLLDLEGAEEGEEGCLSLPELRIQVERARTGRLQALDLEGKPFEQVGEGYVPRIWQHEFDHLNGVMLTDRMGTVARALHRGLLRDLEEEYAIAHPPKPKPASKPPARRARRAK